MILDSFLKRRMDYLKGLKEDPEVAKMIDDLEKELESNEYKIEELAGRNEDIENELDILKANNMTSIKRQIEDNELLLSIQSLNTFEEYLMFAQQYTGDIEIKPILSYIETSELHVQAVNGYAATFIETEVPKEFQNHFIQLKDKKFSVIDCHGVGFKTDEVLTSVFKNSNYGSIDFDMRRIIVKQNMEVKRVGYVWLPVIDGILLDARLVYPMAVCGERCKLYFKNKESPVGFDFGKIKVIICPVRQTGKVDIPIEIQKLKESYA